MLDIKLIRKDKDKIQELLQRKDPTITLDKVVDLDQLIREKKTRLEQLKARRNEISQKIGELKRKGEDTTALMKEVESQGDESKQLEQELNDAEALFSYEISTLPNIPLEETKISYDPKDNVIIKEVGSKRVFDFHFKNHVELNDRLNIFDFKRGAKISGSGWPVYRGLGARLEWALINYMIGIHLKNGFEQWIPPILVRPEVVYGSGQLPKFANQQFKITDDDFSLYLIPTAEVPLNGLFMDEILTDQQLPSKFIAYTPCFRREAGAAGSQERGLIRVHQFNKVEMFAFTKPEDSDRIFNEMMASAEEILQGLELHYRNALLVTGDMSFAAAKTIDIEVWLPGQNRYYEVSSVSNCTDYQARRSNTRFKGKDGKNEFVHTLNGSGLATSRLMVSILENNQNADGSITIPKVLRPMLGGLERIEPVL